MTSPTRDASNALILQDAFVYVADKGTTLPTDVATALTADFKGVGWLDPDGVTITPQGNTTELKGVTGATLAFIKDGDGFQYSCNCLESNDTTDSLLYPNSTVDVSTGVATRTVKASIAPAEKCYVIEEHYTNGKKRRICVPVGQATVGAVKSSYTAFRSYPLTISAIQQSDGELHVDITDNTSEQNSSSSSGT